MLNQHQENVRDVSSGEACLRCVGKLNTIQGGLLPVMLSPFPIGRNQDEEWKHHLRTLLPEKQETSKDRNNSYYI
jgi:hypothetical protein